MDDESTLDLFGADRLGIEKPVKIDLIRFRRSTYFEEVYGWALANERVPVETRHLIGVGIELSTKSEFHLITALGSLREGYAPSIHGKNDRRTFSANRFAGQRYPEFMQFGFLYEEHRS